MKNEKLKKIFTTKFVHIFLLFTFAFLFSAKIFPQEIEPVQNFHQWGAVTIFNGLPSDNVRAIAQTSDGILWFGTDNGLAKFDGKRVQTILFDAEETQKILALETDENGKLWIGTEKGAYVFDGKVYRQIQETKNIAVTSVFISDKIYFSTNEGLIFALTNSDLPIVEKIPSENLRGSDGNLLKITGFAKIGETLVAGTQSRSILTIENGKTFETFSRPRPFFVNVLAQDKNGNAWLGANSDEAGSGLFSLADIARPVRFGAGLGNVSALEPVENSLLVGTEKSGLFQFSGESETAHFTFGNTAGGLRSNTIYAVFRDREGVIWIGTNRGVCRFDASSPFTQTLSDNGNSNFVRTIFRTKNGQIFAGTNRGLFTVSGGNWTEVPEFSGKTIYSIFENSENQIFFATPNGCLDLSGKIVFTGDTRNFVEFQNKTFAAIFGRGAVEISTQTPILTNDSPTAFLSDGNKLLIGTAKDGVFSFDGKQIRSETDFEKLRGAAVWKIVKGFENDYWFASARGLYRFENGELIEVISQTDVRDVVVDTKNVWAATLKGGLFHFVKDENFGFVQNALNVEQGLPSEQIFSVFPFENRLLIGTNRGIVRYLPSEIAPQIVVSRVVSQRIHTSEEIAQKIELEFPQNSLLLEVTGLSSRTFPEQFQYGFLLKNAKGEILDKKLSNEAQFSPSELKAGEYSIEARVFNKDLLVSEPLIITFSVAQSPFPWTATALGILLIIALIGLIWAIIERRRIVFANRELASARFDLANEAERERKRIARDLHDQTLADLRKLMLMSDKIPAETNEFRAEIESVSTEIRRICEDLSPSVLENVGLPASLEFLLQQTFENQKFTAAEHIEEEINFSPNVQMQIYRIAQEVLTNIKRHSDADFVEMNIEISNENYFILQISDDGKFFAPPENASKGRGIGNIRSRAAIIEADVFWKEGETGGTAFSLKKSVNIDEHNAAI
ncbi:MAG TPA: two-component regulator propeller domain-containing protein [Pyrinomonadaceae bacterium]|nr:two-component regulator propeller domain-containing protein [Pyrinomonadaceae bacterium]